jgi:hypothetical protein
MKNKDKKTREKNPIIYLAAPAVLAGLCLLVPAERDLGVDPHQQLVHVMVDP